MLVRGSSTNSYVVLCKIIDLFLQVKNPDFGPFGTQTILEPHRTQHRHSTRTTADPRIQWPRRRAPATTAAGVGGGTARTKRTTHVPRRPRSGFGDGANGARPRGGGARVRRARGDREEGRGAPAPRIGDAAGGDPDRRSTEEPPPAGGRASSVSVLLANPRAAVRDRLPGVQGGGEGRGGGTRDCCLRGRPARTRHASAKGATSAESCETNFEASEGERGCA